MFSGSSLNGFASLNAVLGSALCLASRVIFTRGIHFVTESISCSCFWVDGIWGCFWVCAMVPADCSHESVGGARMGWAMFHWRDTELSSFTLPDRPELFPLVPSYLWVTEPL